MATFKEIREAAKAVWDKPNPKAEAGKSKKLSPEKIAKAKARAKAAGRSYPNMVDNIWAARSEEFVVEEKNYETESGTAKVTSTHVHFNNSGYKQKFSHPEIHKMIKGGSVRGFHKDSEYSTKNTHVFTNNEEDHYLPVNAVKHIKEETELDEVLGPENDIGTKALTRKLMKLTPGQEVNLKHVSEEENKPLNKPFLTPGGPKKRAVYVKDPSTGNVKKVNFGDTTGLTIKTSDPERRKAYRARHNCDNPGPKTKANYWSCKAWSANTVNKGLGK